jgi:flavin-dependent dehydrogenase
MSMISQFDIVVLGGGPAGLISALRLVNAGWRVAVVTQPRRPTLESFSPRVVAALEQAGSEQALTTLNQPVERLVSWAGQRSAANREFIVDRARFDAALAADAERAGVVMLTGRVVKTSRTEEGWSVAISGSREAESTLRGRLVVEARGRAALASGRSTFRGPPTIALARYWRLPRVGSAFTAIAGFPSGWAWFASTGDGTAMLSLVMSGQRGILPARISLDEFYAARLGELAEAKTWLADSTPFGALVARAATAMLTRPVVGDRLIRLGDAALAIDPLSGHGSYEALRAAFTMPALINTLLNRPMSSGLAERFHTERTEDSFVRHARIGRDFYAMETRWDNLPFWAERRIWPDDHPAHISPSYGTSIQVRPVIGNDWIVAREVVVTPDHPLGIWRVAGIPIVPLMQRRLPPSHSPEMAAAARWLKQRRLIDWQPVG